MYQFSVPMPYYIKDINKLFNINKQVERSKITSLYACVPRGCEMFTGFEQSRNFSFDNVTWDYWKGLIEYVLNKNFDFIYLLNSPKPLEIDSSDFLKQLEKLDFLLNSLKNLGVKKIRVASVQLMTYISRHYTYFDVLASTCLDYKTIWEYQNFIKFHPEIKQLIPSHDINKNFKLLSILRKRYPNIEMELMVNEGCLQGCPHRMFHEYISIDKHIMINNDFCLSTSYATSYCMPVVKKYPIQSIVIGTHIYPWEIDEYAKIGINKFKLVGRDGFENFENYIDAYTMYLKGVDNINNLKNNYLAEFIHHLKNNAVLEQLTVKDYKKYLPKIEHFKKYGHLCSSRCGVECKYCYKCAEKIQKVFLKKQQEERKKAVPFCVQTRPQTV